MGRQSTDVHPSGRTSRLPRLLRRPSVRRLCTLGVLAIAGSLVGGISVSADAGETPVAASHEIIENGAPHTATHLLQAEPVGSNETVPPAEQRHGDEASAVSDVQPDGDGDRQTGESRPQTSDDVVVEELQTRLADPILMVAGPSSSHGLSFQEGDPQYPLPFDGFLGDQAAKAVLTGGSARSSKSKATTSIAGGADPHWVNQFCAARAQVAYGARTAAVPDRGTAMQRACAHQKLQSRSPAPRRASASVEAGDATSSAADAGEADQPGSPVTQPVSAAIGQLSFWYVSPTDTTAEAVRADPDEPSSSPD